MPVRVVIARQGSNNILHEWWEDRVSSPLSENQWEKSARIWPEGLLRGFDKPLQIFLCLDREELVEGYETELLGKVIKDAHKAMWGARVYIVVDKRQDLNTEKSHEFHLTRRGWFRELLSNGISDVLALNIDPGDETRFDLAIARSEERAEMLDRHLPSNPWKCLLYLGTGFPRYINRFLGDFLTDTFPEDSSNCLIVLRDCTKERIKFVRKILNGKPTDKIMLGLLNAVDATLSQKLEQLRPVHFHGPFELHYFLQKLNHLYDQHKNILKHAEIVPVQEARFKPHAPQLLITYAFDQNDFGGALAAARDIHILRQALGDKCEIIIHPAIQSSGFRDTLKWAKQLLAWVHIGHGDGLKGLQQADGFFKSSEEWLSCFASHNNSLPLAVFSVCESNTIAWNFARAGVGATIGFKKKVPKNLCGDLIVEIVKAAVESGGDRDTTLDAFGKVKGKFVAAEPVIFCAKH